MSCLSIRLPTAKKVWKSFTSKLQTRLHKLHKSKAIKKPKNINRLQTAASKTTRPSLLLGQRLQRNRCRRRALPFGYQRYYVSKNKAAAPVYVDKLFVEAHVADLVGYNIPHQPSEKTEKNVKLIDQPAAAGAEAGTSKEGDKKSSACVGDGRGESIGLASPILHGIDARAEEFIASFRAEMERQEIIARNL
ncbi:hypothetical protein PTKIN_Ptkin12aG0086000 [Pterospermum kingtungense]